MRGLSPVRHLRYMAIVLLTISDWPSVCGWKAVLSRSLTPASLNKSRHTWLVKTGLRSLTIEVGKPCRQTISWKKALANDEAVYGWLSVMKCAYLESRSTTVRITLLPCTFGKPSTKSIEISDHTNDGTGNGCRRPSRCNVSVLLRWHVAQALTKSRTTDRS